MAIDVINVLYSDYFRHCALRGVDGGAKCFVLFIYFLDGRNSFLKTYFIFLSLPIFDQMHKRH